MLLNDDSLSRLLMEIIRLFHKKTYIIFKKHGITRGQPPILFLLWKLDGRTQNEFSEILYLEAATITVCLQRMEKNKLIKRMQDLKDLRKTRVFLTNKGKRIRNEIEKLHLTIEADCFDNFKMDEKELLKEFLIKIRENLKKEEE